MSATGKSWKMCRDCHWCAVGSVPYTECINCKSPNVQVINGDSTIIGPAVPYGYRFQLDSGANSWFSPTYTRGASSQPASQHCPQAPVTSDQQPVDRSPTPPCQPEREVHPIDPSVF